MERSEIREADAQHGTILIGTHFAGLRKLYGTRDLAALLVDLEQAITNHELSVGLRDEDL